MSACECYERVCTNPLSRCLYACAGYGKSADLGGPELSDIRGGGPTMLICSAALAANCKTQICCATACLLAAASFLSFSKR